MTFDPLERAATVRDAHRIGPIDRRVRRVRIASIVLLVASIVGWNLRATGNWSWSVLALAVGIVLACASAGNRLARAADALVGPTPGIAYEVLLGFFACNTLLFVLTIVSPFGMPVNVVVVGIAALASVGSGQRGGTTVRRSLRGEWGSFAVIAFGGLAATLWVADQQPLVTTVGDRSVFTVWTDVFIHVREISAFAQAHGLASIDDIKLAGVGAAVYHFASYMLPAAFDALTPTSALDAYAAFQLPFGILLTGLAAYVLVAVTTRTTWPAVVAAAAVLALPDSYLQVLGVRYLSFHFMSLVNLGMLYGIACAALAWLFMIEACRRGRMAGLVVAYVLLAILVGYKAHLFVANALLLMLYPCVFFDRENARLRVGWRLAAALALTALFVAVIAISQQSPRVPTMRLDGSGIAKYVDILTGGFRDGPPKTLFRWLYYGHRYPHVVQAALAAVLIVVASFGWWVAVAPPALWRMRRALGTDTATFVAIVVVNYLVMSMGLALDEHGVGSAEEFVNRPHAWAFFVVVAYAAAALALWVRERIGPVLRRRRWWALPIAGLLLVGVRAQASHLQTFPEWEAHADYAQFNAFPRCLVQAARYVRDHGRAGDLMQDATLDPSLVVTALAERQGYVASGSFGGHPDEVRQRIDALRAVQESGDADALLGWARARHVTWYVAHPEDGGRLGEALSSRAVYRCDGFSVIRLGR